MASGNEISTEEVATKEGNLKDKEELERLKEYLQDVLRKNQDLEEMLLYTTQELGKEKENSRKIVQTLTERLMESREMINKVEMENMRYKKDCLLAVELLQCNRSVDQGRIASTVKKLTSYMDEVEPSSYKLGHNVTGNERDPTHNVNTTTKCETKPNRPGSHSKKRSKSEGSNEDTTALLAKKGTNNVSSSASEKVLEEKSLKYHGDLREKQENQTESMSEKLRSSEPEGNPNNKNAVQKENKDIKHETSSDGEKVEESRAVYQIKVMQEDTMENEHEKLLSKVTERSQDNTSQNVSSEVNAAVPKFSKGSKVQEANYQAKATQEDTTEHEHEKLLSKDTEWSQDKTLQNVSLQVNMGVANAKTEIVQDDSIQTSDSNSGANKFHETVSSNDDDDGKSAIADSLSNENASKSDGEVNTTITEADEETLTAEENTPLV